MYGEIDANKVYTLDALLAVFNKKGNRDLWRKFKKLKLPIFPLQVGLELVSRRYAQRWVEENSNPGGEDPDGPDDDDDDDET